MPILNYTTAVPVDKTMGELISMLAAHGCSRIGAYYEAGTPIGLGFAIDTQYGLRNFDLPANIDGVLTVLEREYPKVRVMVETGFGPTRKRRCHDCGKIVPVGIDGQLHPHKTAGHASKFCGRTGR
jgi:hypothetical protein